jgi:hypothetical protein
MKKQYTRSEVVTLIVFSWLAIVLLMPVISQFPLLENWISLILFLFLAFSFLGLYIFVKELREYMTAMIILYALGIGIGVLGFFFGLNIFDSVYLGLSSVLITIVVGLFFDKDPIKEKPKRIKANKKLAKSTDA